MDTLPPEVEREIAGVEQRQVFNPVETEQVEHNLRETKVQRGLPYIDHARRVHKQKEQHP